MVRFHVAFSTMKTMRFSAAIALIGLVIASSASATTYAVNDGYDDETVVGTITTDGKLGVLTASDIVDWNLTLPSPLTLTPANSTVELSGDHLTATSSALLFDYTNVFPALYELIFASNGGELQGSVSYSTNGFNGGGYFVIGVCDVDITCFASLPSFRSGVGVIAEVTDSTTPLPTALLLFSTGLGTLGLIGRGRRPKTTALAA